jgi:5-methyltetrahydropteroyltriglutamate--homocysteine methyltransferase
MSASTKPFFRADQVGSLLRPPRLLAARERAKRGELDAAGLRAIEDECIAEAVAYQEGLGLPAVTDGEFRRENWWIDFISRIGGVEIHEGDADTTAFVDRPSWHYVPKNVVTRARLGHAEPIYGRDFAYLKSVAHRLPKITIPSPTRMHFHGGRKHISSTVYPDIEQFFADVARVYREEIAALEALGCRYIQIDDPLLTYFISDRLRAEVRDNGEDPDARLARYVRLVNDCIAARRPDTAIGIHLCRGNSRSAWIAEGGYERIAEACFGGLQVDHFLLEYDDERSGDFAPLRFVPRGKKVVLGLVTTKHGRLENPDDLARRVDDAAKIVPLEHLAISPQCGFASVVEGNIIAAENQAQKLGLVVDVAKRVWGAV